MKTGKRYPKFSPLTDSSGLFLGWDLAHIQRWAANVSAELDLLLPLLEAVQEWAADRIPQGPSDVDLLIALWRVLGDRTAPCPGCDGECGEPCAPVTAAVAIARLEQMKGEAIHKR